MRFSVPAATVAALICVACSSFEAPAPQPGAPLAALDASPAGQIPKLYEEYMRRQPCPEPAICGLGPELRVSAEACEPPSGAGEVRCVFLVPRHANTTTHLNRCEAAFSRVNGAWRMSGIESCRPIGAVDATLRGPARAPDLRTIEAIESGFALQDDLLTVGVGDSEAMNAAARVRVRRVQCRPAEGATAWCTYEASRCLSGEADPDGDGWCRRRTRFLADLGISPSLATSGGWTIDRRH
jgi:hypothetical protein